MTKLEQDHYQHPTADTNDDTPPDQQSPANSPAFGLKLNNLRRLTGLSIGAELGLASGSLKNVFALRGIVMYALNFSKGRDGSIFYKAKGATGDRKPLQMS